MIVFVMKSGFKMFIMAFSLFLWGNLVLAQNLTVEQFNSLWDSGKEPVCYSGGEVVSCDCTDGDAIRGCVRNARQSTWSFTNQWDVEIRKLVWPTSTPWLFDVNVLLRWKRVVQTRDDLNVCSVVVFDVSGSMWKKVTSWSTSTYEPNEKWYSAVSWAKEFSQVVVDGNLNAKVWLVTFWNEATIKKYLWREVFDDSLFYLNPVWENTNAHAWLIKAREVLSSGDCDAKYVILMSDWVPTNIMNWNTSQLTWNSSNSYLGARLVTIAYAQELKNQWIQIYSIWYNIGTTGRNTLMQIAQDSDHYFDASSGNISEIFQDIWNVTVEMNAWTPSSITDEVWWAMLKVWDIEIVSWAQIIDPGTVYSFQIKISPDVIWFQNSNNGLSLTYSDVTWDVQTLNIVPENTAQIYWDTPKCEWNLPWWVYAVVWNNEYVQTWSGNALVPVSKEWTYVDNPTPWECQWSCNNSDYWWNTNTNTCEIKVRVDFDVNEWTWYIPYQIVVSWMNAVEPSTEPIRVWYQFTWWELDGSKFSFSRAITWNIVLQASWEPNVYTIVFDWNGATAWTMPWKEMIYNQDSNLPKNTYVRNWNEFIWWNTSPDGMWISYTDEQVVKNLATSWEVKLYAQWKKKWSSWWGSWWARDKCPDGDYSWDFYDGKCWNPPKPEPDPTPNPLPSPVVEDKKCSIEGSTHSAEVNEAYIWACEKWIIESDTIQGARLWEFLNRAEMAKIVTIFEMSELDAKPNREKDCSAFMNSIAWYNSVMVDYMITSCQLERMWIHTADYMPISDFMPKKFVSRAEFWTILSRILWWNRYEAEKNTSRYYVHHLDKLKENEILTNINPSLVERRSYAILMIYRAAKMMGKI